MEGSETDRDSGLFVDFGEVVPRGPHERDVVEFLQWAQGQPGIEIHPSIAALGSGLATSGFVPKGTPLIRVASEFYAGEKTLRQSLHEASADMVIDVNQRVGEETFAQTEAMTAREAECQRLMEEASGPEFWPIRLALRLLKESADQESPWRAYIATLPPSPGSACLWTADQVADLQYLPVQRALKSLMSELRHFFDAHFVGRATFGTQVDYADLVVAVAQAQERGVEVAPDRHALVPLVDLVAPEAGGDGPTCVLRVEGDDSGGFSTLSAARDLQPGEVLTRDFGLARDELLLRRGLVPQCGPEDDVVILAGIGAGSAQTWQVRAIERLVDTQPGPQPGDIVVPSRVRRGDQLEEAIGSELFVTARVMACRRKEELYGDEGEWAGSVAARKRGLEGLRPKVRKACLDLLVNTVWGCQYAFPTSAEEDYKRLQTCADHRRRTAVAYRLEKKLVLRDVHRLLRDVQGKVAEACAHGRRKDGAQHAKAGGKKRSVGGRGFA